MRTWGHRYRILFQKTKEMCHILPFLEKKLKTGMLTCVPVEFARSIFNVEVSSE